MIKTIFSAILILTTISCAPMMEETWTVTTPEGPVTIRHYDPARELLFGLYCASLINPSKTQYYYPVIGPYLSGYSYCPPDIWADWSPLQRSLWIQSGIESELRDYEDKIWWINFKNKMDMENEANRIKEEAEDAADELEDVAYDAKLELEDSAKNVRFILDAPGLGIEKNVRTVDLNLNQLIQLRQTGPKESYERELNRLANDLIYALKRETEERGGKDNVLDDMNRQGFEVWWKNFKKKWNLKKD